MKNEESEGESHAVATPNPRVGELQSNAAFTLPNSIMGNLQQQSQHHQYGLPLVSDSVAFREALYQQQQQQQHNTTMLPLQAMKTQLDDVRVANEEALRNLVLFQQGMQYEQARRLFGRP